MELKDLIGNEENKKLLQKIIQIKNFVHSYMFVGKEGIGKQEFAKSLAKSILCLGDMEEKKCKSCLEFETQNHPDFLLLNPENGAIKIEQIRNLMNKAIEKPIIGTRKVYILNDADTMTKEAQNCLLKTLEEPPEYLVIILVVQNESQILTTIKSRCTKIVFKQIEEKILREYLEKEKNFSNITQTELKVFDGSIGNALKWQQKSELYKQIENFFMTMDKKDKIDILNNQNVIYQNKEEILDIISYMNNLFLEKMKEEINNKSKIAKYINCVQILEKTKRKLKSNANFDMCVDNMLLSIWESLYERK